MSSKPAIPHEGPNMVEVHDLGKCYKIYDSPKARLKEALWRGRKQYYREFWALRNVSFEVKKGDSLGIIGRNGSGKSTLLQLICGTLTPTEGSLSTQGRIAALLELGSGFNPEFTGLENIYLNASLLGLSKKETEERLDRILAFADIGDFVGQPVKSYSSGMTVRLAFAVIAHVNADILVVDEALAVGDAIFVQRCMRFIRKMREERCLLFVSHDAEAIKSLCNHALWISKGNTQSYGSCKTVTLDYLRYCHAATYGEEIAVTAIRDSKDLDKKTRETRESQVNIDHKRTKEEILNYGTRATYVENLEKANGWRTGHADLTSITIEPINVKRSDRILEGGEEVLITVCARANEPLDRPVIGFTLVNRLGQHLLGENTFISRERPKIQKAESGDKLVAVFKLWFPMLPSGKYALMASIADGDEGAHIQHHWTEDAVLIDVIASRVRYGLVGGFISNVSLSISRSIDSA